MAPKSQRRPWDSANMKAAIVAIQSKKMGFLKAQQSYQVPRGTLFRLVKLLKDDQTLQIDDVISIPLGRKPVLPSNLETQLVEYCLGMETKYFGLSMTDVRRLAYQLAARNDISNPFNKNDKSAGRKWFNKFLRRNPQLSLRTPQGTSVNRVRGFNEESVGKFFQLLEAEYEKHNYPANRVFNCDETGLMVVQSKLPKVLAKKGKKQIGSLTSAERGSLVTVVTCMSPAGTFIPPLIIFPRTNMKNELMDGAPPGSIFDCHKSGWIQMDMFTKWFKHFVASVKPTHDDPVILILDGHYSHSRNLDVIEYAHANHVVIICLPPHSSHKLQPLDVAFMHPLKTYYNEEIRKWLAQHRDPVRPVTQYQISQLLGRAYARAATVETAINGFKKTGIYPLDKDVFRDDYANKTTEISSPDTVNCDNAGHVSVKDISPVPVLNIAAPSNRGPKRGCALVLTSTPNKNSLEEKKSQKQNTAEIPPAHKRQATRALWSTRRKNKQRVQREDMPSSSEDEESNIDTEESDSEDDDAECLYCKQLWSTSVNTDWVQCQNCKKWADTKCAGNPKKQFVCVKCQKK